MKTNSPPFMVNPSMLQGKTSAQAEAFAQIVVLSAYADGKLTPEEETFLRDRLTSICAFCVPKERVEHFLVELPPLSIASNNWRKDQIRRLKIQLDAPDLHEPAFALAVAVARADTKIGLRESRMLVNMALELDIDPEFARRVLTTEEDQ